jgi:hypothetical protein
MVTKSAVHSMAQTDISGLREQVLGKDPLLSPTCLT